MHCKLKEIFKIYLWTRF